MEWVISNHEEIRNIAIVPGVVFGVLIALWRGVSLSRQSLAAQNQAKVADRSHAAELFGNAVENLGNVKLEMKLGAIYTLRQLESDYAEFSMPVLMVLAAYVRNRTKVQPDSAQEEDVIEILKIFGNRLR